MTYSDEFFEKRAERFLSRTPGNHGHEQTVQFIGETFRIERRLIELERKIDNISVGVWNAAFRDIKNELSDISDDFFKVQRVITSPGEHMHEVLNIGQDEINNKVINEILTQLGWEWLPREQNRVYAVQDRVYRKMNAMSQQILTNRIILVSFLAVLISASAFITQTF